MKKLEAAIVAANRWILILLLGGMACLVFTNVTLRYLTNESIVWSEEAARYMMIWLTFLGSGLVLRFGGHIAIENLHDAVPSTVAIGLRAMVVLGLAALFCVLLYFSLVYLRMMEFQSAPATGISFGYIYAPMPIGCVLLLIHLLLIAKSYIYAGTFAKSNEMDAQAAAL